MQRREFLKGVVAGGAAHFSVYSEGAGFAHRAKASTGLPILEDSVYAGHRYEAMVPDTLDLAGRAELAINGIGGTIDTDLDYYMFFLVRYACKTPYMAHHAADSTCDTKYGESFPLMRLMCGTDRYLEVEAAQRAELLSRLEDGLYWNPYEASRPWRTLYTPEIYGVGKNEDIASTTRPGEDAEDPGGLARDLAGSLLGPADSRAGGRPETDRHSPRELQFLSRRRLW